MPLTIREMTLDDYEAVFSLWQASQGMGISEADSQQSIGRYLGRNPGFSLVALEGEQLVGAALCGHDGRRGFIHHLAVREDHRGQGIGRRLSNQCLASLRAAGIGKCHIFVYTDNTDALAFWESIGWTERIELVILSKYIGNGA